MRAAIHRFVNLRPVKRWLTDQRDVTRLYFDLLYTRHDPYGNLTAAEAHEKYDHAFSLLADNGFRRGLEIGCGEGWNTHRVADVCDEVLALDLSPRAIRRAMAENPHPRVTYQVMDLVSGGLPGLFDYLFCPETLYYLRPDQLPACIDNMVASVAPDGVIHLLHSRSLRDDDRGLELKEFGAPHDPRELRPPR